MVYDTLTVVGAALMARPEGFYDENQVKASQSVSLFYAILGLGVFFMQSVPQLVYSELYKFSVSEFILSTVCCLFNMVLLYYVFSGNDLVEEMNTFAWYVISVVTPWRMFFDGHTRLTQVTVRLRRTLEEQQPLLSTVVV